MKKMGIIRKKTVHSVGKVKGTTNNKNLFRELTPWHDG
jgi:hypothetical protein